MHLTDPLAGLDDIDWGELEHAYGSAEDTPTQLRRYWAGKTAETRRRGLRALSHSVYHQSGGFSASPPALRFLLRLLAHPEARLKEDLLRLVVSLGVPGNIYDLTIHGYRDPTEWLSKYFGDGLDDFFQCRTLYEGAIDTFIALLDQAGARLRARAAHALALLPGEAARIIPALRARYDVEPDPVTRASIVLALAVISSSSGVDEGASSAQWLRPRRKRARHPTLRICHTIATVYALQAPPSEALTAEIIEIMQAPPGCDAYPLPWLNGDLDELCGEVLAHRVEAHEWPVSGVWLEAYRAWAAEHTPSLTDHRADDVGRRLLRQATRLSAGDEALRTEILTEIALRPALVLKTHGELQGALRNQSLPAYLPEIVAHLGWQPPRAEISAPLPLREQLPDRPWVSALPEALLDADIDLSVMLLKHHPMTPRLLRAIAPLLVEKTDRGREPWTMLSGNRQLQLDEETLFEFADRWHTWDLLHNPAVEWTEARVERWPGWFNWRALSRRADFPWSMGFIERHMDELDWSDMSINRGLPWSEAFIDAHADEWCWHLLSQNPSLPWSEALLRRYRRWYWNYLSNNDGLPWSDAFIRDHWDRLDLCQLCKVTTLPWTVGWLHRHQHVLSCWGNLSANPGLPWSALLVRAYQSRWNWRMLSANPALPWSAALISEHEGRWHWESLVKNPGVPWDDTLVAMLAEHAEEVSPWCFRYEAPQIPWREAWLRDPRLARLLNEDDPQLYARFIAPHLDDGAVQEIFEVAAGRVGREARARWAQLRARRPELTLDHPLPRALNLTDRIRRVEQVGASAGTPSSPRR